VAQASKVGLPSSDVLKDEGKLSYEVRRILSMDRASAQQLIGDTTTTAYRRIHEVVTSVLDRIAGTPEPSQELLLDLSKALILVKYQLARGQISRGLAEHVERAINTVFEAFERTPKNWESVRSVARNARTYLDSLAVIVYMHSRR
jgi:hypothetical protein